ncbi:rifin [Plasmodium falciparum NF54]|uniref:Rifin n=2 Tax=Plasmodium falciparum TaxID=5833 RepID=A0A146M1Z3_PLAF7|nr:rifin [Plasmodium falciparum 3D7]KAF4330333.1 rifin [Plasmodium falciparum NF54]PKC46184.1 rifin [Plasmodium falciparum NF54]CZT62777.1 rifin [Plasmodium falciparum 3D7]|eukprot:XP_002808729.1 rifin [Plasmodium falciparum 3D7]
MKIHYINILLFVILLNILINDQRNHKNTTHHTPKISTTRLLCECELYAPSNYDNDPQMKAVMENYNRQTSDRFKEYDERMKTTRQKCKDKCDKEIQNIILKDKLEKELAEKFVTLQTDIQNDAIPTCVCEKSLADKTEKFCLNCSKNMGAIAPWWGLVCGVGYAGWSHYVPFAISKAAMDAGMNVVINVLKQLGVQKVTAVIFKEISSINDFTKVAKLTDVIYTELKATCAAKSYTGDGAISADICTNVINGSTGGSAAERLVSGASRTIAHKAPQAAEEAAKVTTTYKSITSSLTTAITASIIAIVVIILIMVIIYLILRYRRKKKMKKKLQYIKLLEE